MMISTYIFSYDDDDDDDDDDYYYYDYEILWA